MIKEGKIPKSHQEVRRVASKIKEFTEPEQQEEILNLWGQKSDEDEETFDGVVEQYREIADGERPIEMEYDDDPSKIRFNNLKNQCDPLLWLTPAKLKKIEHKQFYDRSIALLKKTENHIHKLLIQLKEYEVVE